MPQSERRSFTFENVHLAPDEQIGLHQQSTWELSYVIVGSGMRLIGDMTEPFLGGEVVMIPPEIPHCWYFEDDDTDEQGRIANITVTFDNDFLDRCSGTFPELCGHIDKLKKKYDAVKFDKEKSEAIIDLLEDNNLHHKYCPIFMAIPLIKKQKIDNKQMAQQRKKASFFRHLLTFQTDYNLHCNP